MKRGIVRTAFGVLKRRPALLCFPAMNVAALAAVVTAAWLLPLSGVRDRALNDEAPTTPQTAVVFALLALLSCVGTYFTAALLHSVHALLEDRRPTIRASLGAILRRMPVLACWSVLGTLSGIYRMTLYHRASTTPLPPTLPRHSTLPAAQVGLWP